MWSHYVKLIESVCPRVSRVSLRNSVFCYEEAILCLPNICPVVCGARVFPAGKLFGCAHLCIVAPAHVLYLCALYIGASAVALR